MPDTFTPLVRRTQAADPAAFSQLVRLSARLVYARIYLHIGDPHRTEDLVQETFLQAWRSIRDLRDPAGFLPWLLAIARRLAIDSHRYHSRKKRSFPLATPQTLDTLPDPRPTPPESAHHREQRRLALQALRSLPKQYRLPLILRYLNQADHLTISQQLGLSNGSLRGLLQRGLTLLREKLSQPPRSP